MYSFAPDSTIGKDFQEAALFVNIKHGKSIIMWIKKGQKDVLK